MMTGSATVGVFPSVFHSATLGTFTPPDATVDLHVHGHQTSATERVTWTDSLYGETTVQAYDYQTDVVPQGSSEGSLTGKNVFAAGAASSAACNSGGTVALLDES